MPVPTELRHEGRSENISSLGRWAGMAQWPKLSSFAVEYPYMNE